MKCAKRCYEYDLSDLIDLQDEKINSHGEYEITCPLCKDEKESFDEKYIDKEYTKRKLHIDPSMSVGYCHRCGTAFFDKSGISVMKHGSKWKNLRISEPEFICIPYKREPKLDESSSNYLLNRCPQLYSKIDLKEYGILPIYRKLVIKFDLNGEDFFYQLRYQYPDEDNEGNRYYTPVTGNLGKPLYFALGKFNPANPTIIVEGVFTAISEKLLAGPNINVIAILGHAITNFQMNMLNSLGQFGPLFIHMDETSLSIEILKTIKSYYPSARVIPTLNYKNEEGKLMDTEEIIRYGKMTPYEYHNYLLNKMNLNNLSIK